MMRKIPILCAILTTIILLTGSCKHQSVVEKLGLQFDTIHIESTTQLVDSGVSPHCQVNIDLIVVKGDEYRQLTDSLLRSGVLQPDYLSLTSRSFTPREALDTFVIRYATDYREFYGGLLTEDATEADSACLSLTYQLTTEIEEGRDDVLCHISHVSRSEGDLTTSYTVVNNMDMAKRKLLHLDDVFVPGYQNGLNEAILKSLEAKTGIQGLNNLRQAGYFVSTDVYAPNNIKLGDDYITFIYMPSEIADREKGEVAVDVKYSAIKRLLNK